MKKITLSQFKEKLNRSSDVFKRFNATMFQLDRDIANACILYELLREELSELTELSKKFLDENEKFCTHPEIKNILITFFEDEDEEEKKNV